MGTKNVTIGGVGYTGVAKVELPITGSQNNAVFVETSDADAVAGDVVTGKTCYVNGQKITGTNSGVSAGAQSGTFTPSAEASSKTITVDGTCSNLVVMRVQDPTQTSYNLYSLKKLTGQTAQTTRCRLDSGNTYPTITLGAGATVSFAEGSISISGLASGNRFEPNVTYVWFAW